MAYRLGGEALEALNTRLAGRGSFFASGASAVDATAPAPPSLPPHCHF